MAWQEIRQGEDGIIGKAIELLQKTSPGSYEHLSVDKLNAKLTAVRRPPEPDGLHALRLYSFGDSSVPLVSAFFFLRRRKSVGSPNHPGFPLGPDAPELWAYCLTERERHRRRWASFE